MKRKKPNPEREFLAERSWTMIEQPAKVQLDSNCSIQCRKLTKEIIRSPKNSMFSYLKGQMSISQCAFHLSQLTMIMNSQLSYNEEGIKILCNMLI